MRRGWSQVRATGVTSCRGFGDWIDLPGAAVAFSTSANAVVDLTGVTGGIIAPSGNPYAQCGLRFVVDGAGLGDSTYGDGAVTLAQNGTGVADSIGLVIARRLSSLGAGAHTVKVQLDKTPRSRRDR